MGTNVSTQNSLEKKIIAVEAAVFIAISLFYAYSVNQAILNVVSREKSEEEITALSTLTSALEFEYIEKTGRISMDLARSMGFEETKSPAFVSRQPLKESLSLGNASR